MLLLLRMATNNQHTFLVELYMTRLAAGLLPELKAALHCNFLTF